MIKIIVTGHGRFASGFESSIKMLAGSNSDVYYVDFLEDDSDVLLMDKISSVIDENKDADYLIICDMAGGTPFNVSARIASEKENIEVVAGANLSSIMEILFTKEDYSIDELAGKIVEISKEATLVFEQGNHIEVDDIEEGI